MAIERYSFHISDQGEWIPTGTLWHDSGFPCYISAVNSGAFAQRHPHASSHSRHLMGIIFSLQCKHTPILVCALDQKKT